MFELNGTTLAAIGAIIGTLAGAVSFVFKQLLGSKDAQINELQLDRDYWRDLSVELLRTGEKAVELAERTAPRRSRHS